MRRRSRLRPPARQDHSPARPGAACPAFPGLSARTGCAGIDPSNIRRGDPRTRRGAGGHSPTFSLLSSRASVASRGIPLTLHGSSREQREASWIIMGIPRSAFSLPRNDTTLVETHCGASPFCIVIPRRKEPRNLVFRLDWYISCGNKKDVSVYRCKASLPSSDANPSFFISRSDCSMLWRLCAGIDIAHPDFQEDLERQPVELNYL
jgi:hypothetical protein